MSKFKFKLSQEITLNGGSTIGYVVGRAEFVNSECTYLVRFEDKEGQKQEKWIYENLIIEGRDIHKLLDLTIEDLGLPVRAITILKENNIFSVRDLVQCSETKLLRHNGFGRKTLNDTIDILSKKGLSLGLSQP